MAAPTSRITWLLARYAGLAACLLLTGVLFAVVWQLLMLINDFGRMNNLQAWSLGMLVLEWLSLGAIGLVAGTATGFSTALFASFGLWITGLIAPIAALTLGPSVPATQQQIIEFFAQTWNFQRFNIVDQITAGAHTVVLDDLTPRLIWASSLIIGSLALGCLTFHKKDLT